MAIDNGSRLVLPDEPRFLIGATGSIASSELPGYLDALRAAYGGSYTVLMTHTATHFVSVHLLALHAERIMAAERPEDWATDRPSRLAEDHDALIVLPATANILANVATGAAPNRLATVILSAGYPSVFVPHMGARMWRSPAVSRNVRQIRDDGHHVIEPEWRSSRDVVTGQDVEHPAVPQPESLLKRLAEVYSLGA